MTSPRPLAIITGGTSGIGAGIAEVLVRQFDIVLVFEKNEVRAQTVLAKLSDFPGSKIRIFKKCLRDLSDAEALHTYVHTEFTQDATVLVHAAGRIQDDLFLNSNFLEQVELIQQHLIAAMALTKTFLPPMYAKKFGRVLLMSSLTAQHQRRGQAGYAAAKAGLEGFCRTLALEVAHRGITVNCIAPGLIETPMTKSIVEGLLGGERKIRERVPAGFIGQVEDVAALAQFLCSPAARYITGAVIPIDGGQSLGDVRL